MSRRIKFWLLALVFLATLLRFRGLFANTYHSDEALFATWAKLIASGNDPLLRDQLLDKPPLLFYIQALSYLLSDYQDWGARIPNLIASIISVPLTGILAWRLFHHKSVAVLSAAFMSLSPLAIQFSSTAFTDPLMLALLLAALTIILGRNQRSGNVLAGIMFGLAIATKFQAALFLPLLMGVTGLRNWDRKARIRFGMGSAPLLFAIVLWEAVRSGGFTLWDQQIVSYGGIRMSWSWDLWSRIISWYEHWRFLFSWEGFGAILICGLVLIALTTVIDRSRLAYGDQLLALYLIAYMATHWLLAIPTWDRYVLPLVPFSGILLARIVAILWKKVSRFVIEMTNQKFRRLVAPLALMLLIMTQLPMALRARTGSYPIGGQSTADNGVSHMAAILKDEPYGTVLYDHRYSWQWRYYLFDSRVYVSWFHKPDSLVEDLMVFGRDNSLRFLAIHNSGIAAPIKRVVSQAGFDLLPIKPANNDSSVVHVSLFRIVPR